MSNPTSNFNWQMPTNTDLVTDLPADFEVFGQAVDTTLADLKGGTSGQILAKNSNTDMDFVWIANDQGDITGITATSPLTGGGTSGAITVGIQAATTSQSGAVQLTDSTSSTSTTRSRVSSILGGGAYRWEMEKIGIASVNLQTIYASKYVANKAKGTVIVVFEVDSTGKVLDLQFTPTKDGAYNRKLREALVAIRFRPAVNAQGVPVRGKAEITYSL